MRPEIWRDLALPTAMIERFQKMDETESRMNMLFHGNIGTGRRRPHIYSIVPLVHRVCVAGYVLYPTELELLSVKAID
jgi:hypothetical protein